MKKRVLNKMAQDYYNTQNKKTADFSKGFFFNVLIGIIVIAINFFIGASNMSGTGGISITNKIIGVVVLLAVIFLEVVLLKKYFKERRYIAIGLLSSLILPLLVSGACSIMFLLK
jgi:hypothetical protein